MAITSEEFDGVLGQWKEWQSYPWGDLLYSTSRLNIQRHIGGYQLGYHPLRVLDVGGGNGRDTIYYAQQGHSVVMVDYSQAMLAEARKAAEEQNVTQRITFYQADTSDIQDLLRGQQFDLILCHLMIEFVERPYGLLKDICNLLAPGGLLSLIDANRYSEAYRIAFQRDDLAAATEAIGNKDYFHPWFKRVTPQFSAQEMIEYLETLGCTLVNQYGIRCINDYLPNERKFESPYYAKLEKLEHRLTETYPYYLLARFFQLIMRKNDPNRTSEAA